MPYIFKLITLPLQKRNSSSFNFFIYSSPIQLEFNENGYTNPIYKSIITSLSVLIKVFLFSLLQKKVNFFDEFNNLEIFGSFSIYLQFR